MAEATPDATIRQIDPFYGPHPYLDFQVLRQEGLKHIGELSGQLWTDHNAHDPGITILEVLCYTLIDLGYRSTLPIEDLLATTPNSSIPATDFSPDDNFFAPLEILSCNPTTFQDYRRLLLEVDGVRNAWLEPAREGDPSLYLVPELRERTNARRLSCRAEDGAIPIYLNGLYRILIEREPDFPEQGLDEAIRKILLAHRNLCEDFEEVVMLQPYEVGICADVEIAKTAVASTVYGQIIEALTAYIAPKLRFYTLKELLDKGKAIEEIFAGRPFLTGGVGFVDTDELESLALRREFHASDFYRKILAVDGVIAIRDLSLQAGTGKQSQHLRVPDGSVAAFAMARTCLQLRVGENVLGFDKIQPIFGAIGRRQILGRSELDLPVPQGRFSPELAEYRSVQYEFPLVYGIGAQGLPGTADLHRKVKAQQLKGYLLFYDRLLADYLAQMANVRRLFSLRRLPGQEAPARQTYFSQALTNAPGGERLLLPDAARNLADGCILAVPVADDEVLTKCLRALRDDPTLALLVENSCEMPPDALAHFASATPALREASVRQAMRDLAQGDYDMETCEDRDGYFFVIRFAQGARAALIGSVRSRTASEARTAGNLTAFLATQPKYYRKASQRNQQEIVDYRYDLVASSAADDACLQHLSENEDLYLERREAFLNHLLARFANQFTVYAAARYGVAETTRQEREQAIEIKSRFLSQYDVLSRDRGRAFNYDEPSWKTGNVSGYEMRTCLLTGISDWTRRRLCKLEVLLGYRLTVDNPTGQPWFRGPFYYSSEENLREARADLMRGLRRGEGLHQLEGVNAALDTEAVRRIFSEIPADENIETLQHVYGLQLKELTGEVRRQSARRDYAGEDSALADSAGFLEEIKATGEPRMELEEAYPSSRLYLDARELRFVIDPVLGYGWVQNDESGQPVAGSAVNFADEEAAWMDFAEHGNWSRFITREDQFGWQMTDAQGNVLLKSAATYEDAASAIKGWRQARETVSSEENYVAAGAKGDAEYHVQFRDANGEIFGITPGFADAKARNIALKSLRKTLKELGEPVKIVTETRQFRWQLRRATDGESVLESAQPLPSEQAAEEDFCRTAQQSAESESDSFFARHVYVVEALPTGSHCQFVYRIGSPDDTSVVLWRSTQSFASAEEAGEAYRRFVDALPTAQPSGAALTQDGQPVAVLAEDTAQNQEAADRLLAYLHKQYSEPGEDATQAAGWIYRLLDRDHPAAITTKCHDTESAARDDVSGVRRFVPWECECEHEVLQIISPALDPKRFHYALSLPDDPGAAVTCLISYLGYLSREEARNAGELRWLQLIEKASDVSQYGSDKPIALEETYASSTDIPPEAQPYWAVLSGELAELARKKGIEPAQYAVELARRYPIRIIYEKDDAGKNTAKVKGYCFQGYDPTLKKTVWRSAQLYDSVPEALEAHAVFRVVLRNPESIRVVCEEGKYCIHLVEILAESKQVFQSAEEAWGEQPACTESAPCQGDAGARLFAKTAIEESAYLPTHGDGCYGFEVVGADYQVARHPCAYRTVVEQQKAADDLHDWAQTLSLGPYSQAAGAERVRFELGEGYYFEVIRQDEPALGQAMNRFFYLGIDSTNYYPAGGAYELHDPFEGNTRLGWAARENLDFQLDAFVRLVRQYPVFKQGDEYRLRLYYPENGRVLNETLKVCGCEKPAEAARFCGIPYILESVRGYRSRADAEAAIPGFLALVKDQRMYEPVAESGLGPYSFMVVDRTKALAIHPYCQPGVEAAARAAQRARACSRDEGMHLIEHLLLRPRKSDQETACECLLPVCPDLDCRLVWEEEPEEDDPCAAVENPPLDCIPGADPYSFWATITLPSWHRRFDNEDARQRFKETLYEEAPAMVGLNIVWLGPKQMGEFEEAFRTWMEWRRDPRSRCVEGSNALCELVRRFKELRNDTLCQCPQNGPVRCDCLPKEDDAPGDCRETPSQLFWHDCPGEVRSTDPTEEASDSEAGNPPKGRRGKARGKLPPADGVLRDRKPPEEK